jgi:hypothetical protein
MYIDYDAVNLSAGKEKTGIVNSILFGDIFSIYSIVLRNHHLEIKKGGRVNIAWER